MGWFESFLRYVFFALRAVGGLPPQTPAASRRALRGGGQTWSVLLMLGLAACSEQPPSGEALSLEAVSFEALPGWESTSHAAALEAFQQSCSKFSSHPEKIPQRVADADASISGWMSSCQRAGQTPPDQAQAFFTRYFQPYQAMAYGDTEEGLVTGYYEPLLRGSRTQSAEYPYPVWGVPADLQPGVAYLSHREIDMQGLQGKAEALLYVNDKVDLFFLQIQGSGRVLLPDGEIVKLAYAGKNGHAYTAIGRYLIENDLIPRSELSAPRLKQWLRENPEQGQEIMYQNASYVFFKWGEQVGNAVGAQGVPLTPEASIAVDPSYMPYGVPVYLDTTLPYTQEAYRKLVVAQDTGGAIKGPLRADLFTGFGERAEHIAGGMKQMARFFVLLPRS